MTSLCRNGPVPPAHPPAQVSGQQLAFAKPEDQAAQQQQAEPGEHRQRQQRSGQPCRARQAQASIPCRTERLAPYWSARRPAYPGSERWRGTGSLPPRQPRCCQIPAPDGQRADHRQRQTNGHIGQKDGKRNTEKRKIRRRIGCCFSNCGHALLQIRRVRRAKRHAPST